MIIKKLSKEELAEGLTLELVNKVSMDKNYSPIQFASYGITSIMKCSSGFWLMVDGKATKGEDGKLLVLSERDCQIGRARYLLTHGAAEKEQKIQAEIARLKKQVRDKIDEVKKNADLFLPREGSISSILADAIKSQLIETHGEHWYQAHVAEEEEKKNWWLKSYNQLEGLWHDGKIIELLEGLEIKKFDPLMISVKYDDAEGMRVLKNTFSAGKIDEWMDKNNMDTLYKYIQIEIEKQYPI